MRPMKHLTKTLCLALWSLALGAVAATVLRTPTPNATPSFTPTPVYSGAKYFFLEVPDRWAPFLDDLASGTATRTYSKDSRQLYVKVVGASPATIQRLRSLYTEINPEQYADFVAASGR